MFLRWRRPITALEASLDLLKLGSICNTETRTETVQISPSFFNACGDDILRGWSWLLLLSAVFVQ